MDSELTKEVLSSLLETKGVRLPMASTILRFKNPEIYQIIDQRVYRLIYGIDLKMSTKIHLNIKQYFEYISDLKRICKKIGIPFIDSDRILYEYDKIVNKENIKY